MPPNNLYTRRQYRQIERVPTIRNELAAALWELRRLRRENREAQRNVTIWQRQVEIMENQVSNMFMDSWDMALKLAGQRSHTTDLQVYALRRVVMVQRREIMELREELARLQWAALCAVADHEGAGMVEEFALSGAPLPKWEYQYKPASGDQVTARDCMVASEPVLSQDWDSAEDNEAWAHLGDVPPLPPTFTLRGHDGVVEDGDA